MKASEHRESQMSPRGWTRAEEGGWDGLHALISAALNCANLMGTRTPMPDERRRLVFQIGDLLNDAIGAMPEEPEGETRGMTT